MIQYNKQKLENIAQKYRLSFVILHGSYARGAQRSDSDVDIAVVAKKGLDLDQLVSLYKDIQESLDVSLQEKELDFKTLEHADPLFRYEVVRDGILLYGDITDYEEFKAVSVRMFDDAKPLFELEKTLALKYQQHLRENYGE